MTNRYAVYEQLVGGEIESLFIRDMAGMPEDLKDFLPNKQDWYRTQELAKKTMARVYINNNQTLEQAYLLIEKLCSMYNTIDKARTGMIDDFMMVGESNE